MRIRSHAVASPCGTRSEPTGLYSVGTGTGTHARSVTRSERSSLSSNVARNVPSSALSARLIWPRMPDTVCTAAPSNLATSSDELNMSLMYAVFLYTLNGSPTSLSFFTTFTAASSSRTTPVAEIRKVFFPSDW